jgi:hypothetical protein
MDNLRDYRRGLMASTFPDANERIDSASETIDVIPVWRFLLDLPESVAYIHHQKLTKY